MHNPVNELESLLHLMRPPGQGIPTVSAGKGAGAAISLPTLSFFKGATVALEDEQAAWLESFDALMSAKVILLGVPMDTGAGIRRGAAYGPRGIRGELLKREEYQSLLRSREVVDLGDLWVNPHLLHDDMLNDRTIAQCQREMYPLADEKLRSRLPVSPLSQLKWVSSLLARHYPRARLCVLGGDHSIGWPVTQALHEVYGKDLGILQFDAHTDLLVTRLGVETCFGTWSYHAQNLIGPGKMIQLGIRQSGRDQVHWESTTGVVQYWAKDIIARSKTPTDELCLIDEVVQRLLSAGVSKIYLSNDIDGTDEYWAGATGTPASSGLSPEFVEKMIVRIKEEFSLVAADLVEVAPDLAENPDELARTLTVSASYVLESIR